MSYTWLKVKQTRLNNWRETIMNNPCYHCGQDADEKLDLNVLILGQQRPMCCVGCQAVAQAIVQSGSESYYQFRTSHNETPEFTPQTLPKSISQELKLYDHEDVLSDISQIQRNGLHTIALVIDGITCAACTWLIEKQLQQFDGVEQANLNLSQHRLQITWDQNKTPISELISRIYALGFKAQPYSPDAAQMQLEAEQKLAMRRLVLAALCTMQAMMFAVPLYVGDWAGLFVKFETYFRFAGLAISTPVVLYSARPFFKAFWRDIKSRHLTMDVPVSIAIGGAYLASIWSTFTHGEEVYYDSVCMFTFFLLLGRFLENRARINSSEAGNLLGSVLPRSAIRLSTTENTNHSESSFTESVVPVTQLSTGDYLRIPAGETIPADGIIINGRTSIDESIMTGEFIPVSKQKDDDVIAGSLNVDSPIDISITALGQDMRLSTVMSLLNRAAEEKPKIAQMADNIAQYFVMAVLVLSAIVFTSWYLIATDKAFWITLSVLVATCPCALSLATPTALTAATSALRKQGILITRGHVLETLTHSKRIIFDKTGTLTLGLLNIERTQLTDNSLSEQDALAIASALETHSSHPIANAFKAFENTIVTASNIQPHAGKGIEGVVNGQTYFLGHKGFVIATQETQLNAPDQRHWIALSTIEKTNNSQTVLAWFLLSDEIRPQAKQAIHGLRQLGLTTEILSGDQSDQVQSVSKQLEIERTQGGISPEGKLNYISSLDKHQASIMVGDGINDVPVLAKAPISIAIGSASDLAKTHADIILVNNQLNRLPQLIQHAQKCRRIIRQNLIWALLYNGSILPLAALGMVPPYAAAIGMSCSSLVVVFNALRLSTLK
jgi:Cu2+-exporting ATPase